jgi:hypothetical protein
VSAPADRRGEQPTVEPKVRDRALILPLVGALLLLPPLAGIFQLEVLVFGLPFTAVYLFAVWAFLIAGAALLAPRLQGSSAVDQSAPSEGQPDA